jgi:hypothetical protein
MIGNNSVPSLVQSRSSTGAISQQSTLIGGYSQSNRSSTGVISQQLSVGPDPSGGSDALRAAVLKFRARLSGSQLTEFKSTTYEQLCDEVLKIQREQESNKSMMNLSRIQACLEAMNEFGKTIEVFLNVSDVICFIWGPIKFLLLVRLFYFI